MALFSSSRPGIRGRVLARFPANAVGANGLAVTKANGVYTIKPSFGDQIATTAIAAADTDIYYALIYNSDTGAYTRVSMDVLLTMFSAALDPTLVSIAALTPTTDEGIYFSAADTAAVYSLTAGGRALSGLTGAADKLPYFTSASAAALATFTAYGRSIVAVADEAAFKALVNLEIGTDVQAYDGDLAALAALTGTNTIYYRSAADTWTAVTIGGLLSFSGGTLNVGDAELTALAGLTSAADKLPYFTGSGTADLADFTAFGRTLIANANASDARTDLGLVIGTDVQAYDAFLASIAALGTAADKGIYITALNTAAEFALTSYGRSIAGVADEAAFKALVNLEPGTDVQAYNARLADLAGASWAQGDIIYFNGTNLVRLPAGTNGQLLKTQGTGANPTWVTASGTGDMLGANNLSDVASAATAFSNIKQAASSSATGVVELAIDTEYRTGTDATRALTPDCVWDAAAEVTLTDAATIAVDMSTFINAVVTLAGNRALGNPTNEKVGQSGLIRIVQDATGSRTLSYGTDWEFAGGTAPVLTTTANAQDLLFYHVIATDRIFATLIKAIA